jgi:hypothetical protein
MNINGFQKDSKGKTGDKLDKTSKVSTGYSWGVAE